MPGPAQRAGRFNPKGALGASAASGAPSIYVLGKAAAGQNQVGQGEERVQLRDIFGQTPITNLPIFEEVFEVGEGRFYLGANLRFDLLNTLGSLLQLAFRQGAGPLVKSRDLMSY